MTIPNYLATFRRAVRELGTDDECETTLNSLNSLISHPATSNAIGRAIAGREAKSWPNAQKLRPCEKSELSEKTAASPFAYAEALDRLERRCPDYVEPDRWQQCVEDAQRFLADWGDKATALGWTAEELFGLHIPPMSPHPSYSRLSRYDATGLLWLLDGKAVVVLTEDTAGIRMQSGAVVTYRRHNKPALGPLADSFDDLTA
jgi:hypothetical protein